MNVNELYEKNQQFQLQIIAFKEKVIKLEDLIKKNEKKMWTLCEHEWKYDTSCGINANLCHYCKHCRLWRHEYMYT